MTATAGMIVTIRDGRCLDAVELPSPGPEQSIDMRRPDDRFLGHLEVGGVEDERLRLEPAHAPVEGDQLLERAAFVEVGIVEAADEDVWGVRKAVGACEVDRRVRREVRQWVLALDLPAGEVVD